MSDLENMVQRLLDALLGAGSDLPALSPTEGVILRLLIAHPDAYGLELVARSDGSVKRGSVYVLMHRMEGKGFVESKQEEQSAGATALPRRLYRATGHGVSVLHAYEVAALAVAGRLVGQ